jgi:S-adenosylmethionine:tRNA ribosyltransferase-isomerase
MKLDDFDYDLPPSAIADRPTVPRHQARLLDLTSDNRQDRRVIELPSLINSDDLLIVNNTKVIPARLIGKRGEVKISITLHRQTGGNEWHAFAKPAKKLRLHDEVIFADDFSAMVVAIGDNGIRVLQFNRTDADLVLALHQYGEMPLPPYISRPDGADKADEEDYQTMFARNEGAVAAPTAGLHFDDTLMAALQDHSIPHAEVTLHVGAGTFLPVKTDDPKQHIMHKEWGEISHETAAAINACRARGGRIVAVGTTSLRLLESCWRDRGKIEPYQAETDLFILPGYAFGVVDMLLTNFHLPKSTLLMLVYAFAGQDRVRAGYEHALANGYRFFSYGDACLMERNHD